MPRFSALSDAALEDIVQAPHTLESRAALARRYGVKPGLIYQHQTVTKAGLRAKHRLGLLAEPSESTAWPRAYGGRA